MLSGLSVEEEPLRCLSASAALGTIFARLRILEFHECMVELRHVRRFLAATASGCPSMQELLIDYGKEGEKPLREY